MVIFMDNYCPLDLQLTKSQVLKGLLSHIIIIIVEEVALDHI